MSDLDRASVALLFAVALMTLLVKVTSCSGGLPESQNAPAASATTLTVIVTADSVNLRQSPSRSASLMARAERGRELELLGTQEDWYNVRWGEGSAWLSKLYASPTEDCPTEQSAAPDALLTRLPGEWKGEVGGRPATFVFYARNGRLCAYVLYPDVKEVVDVQAAGSDALTLVGKRYERLAGTNGPFGLDTFSARLESASERLSGTFFDTNNNRGEWFAARPGAAQEEAQLSTNQPQLAEVAVSPESPDSAATQTAAEPAAGQVVAEPSEEPAASTPDDATESRFMGRWEGTGKQFSPRQQWNLEMEITSDAVGTTVGTISYPTLRCGGDLFLRAADKSTWTMRERITYGRCTTGGSITMTLEGRDRAQWLWHYAQGELGAQGEVRRQTD
ncbi:MAG: hypothetical protein QOF89_526 [Acidobacteriota bacterium]|jgi:hypothetical protein|nr:hypothetical protein [Acidobacteriota bacterium]